MSISRHSAIVRGPAVVEFSGGSGASAWTYTFRTKGDVTFNHETQAFDVESSELGVIDQRASEIMATVKFTPVGVVDADGVAILWPHLAKLPGQSLFGSGDVTVKIRPVAGSTHSDDTIHLANAAVTKMPDIVISAVQTQVGEVEVRGILADDDDWDVHSHWWSDSDGAPTLETLSPSNIPTTPGTVAWGGYYTNIKTAEGVTISFDMQTQDEVEDEEGIYDITLTGLSAKASLTPVAGASVGDFASELGLYDVEFLRGSSIPRHDLVVTSRDAGGLAVTVYNAALRQLPLAYGATSRRVGQLTFEGLRGTGNAVAAVSIVAAASASATEGNG